MPAAQKPDTLTAPPRPCSSRHVCVCVSVYIIRAHERWHLPLSLSCSGRSFLARLIFISLLPFDYLGPSSINQPDSRARSPSLARLLMTRARRSASRNKIDHKDRPGASDFSAKSRKAIYASERRARELYTTRTMPE